MKKILALMLSALMLLALTACGSERIDEDPSNTDKPQPTEQGAQGSGEVARLGTVTLPESIAFDDYDALFAVREANPVGEDFLAAVNRFAYESAAKVLNNGGENGCYSPLSLYYALAIAATGASGETQQEMLGALGVAEAAALSQQAGNLFRLLYSENDVKKLNLANSLWIDDEFNPKDAFVQNAVENFYAETYRADLATQEAMDAMAEWVNAHTNGKLSPSFEPDEDQLMTIINTIYYINQWQNQFDAQKTAKDTFTLENGETVECDFMNRVGSQGYYKGANFALSSLSLADGDRMVFVLPDEGTSVSDLLADGDTLAAILTSQEEAVGEVTFKLPKFDQASEMDLIETLRTMGIADAFEDYADFSGIADEDMFISAVKQQCRVAVDENGVEATAYTAVVMTATGLPMGTAEMILDRPFLYAIVSSNGTVMFLGACMNPAA